MLSVAWLAPEYIDGEEAIEFVPPSSEHFSLPPAVLMTGTEFQGREFQSKKKIDIQASTDYACEITSNDVVFAPR